MAHRAGTDPTKSEPTRRVTMTDVARRAQVSVAAVSYALNGGPGVSAEMRERITRIADELGFRPSRLARELRTGTTKTIGLLLTDIANPFGFDLASGVIATATAANYEVFVSHGGTEGERQTDAAMAQVDRRSSGLLLATLRTTDAALLSALRRGATPFVQVGRWVDEVDADWVGIDDYAAGRDIGRHVADCGYRRVAVLSGPKNSGISRERARGALDALHAAGLTVVNAPEVWGPLTRDSGAARAEQLFSDSPDIDAMLCVNDVIALGVLDVCHKQGRRVPEDVAVTGIDDMSFSSAGPLQLTTVSVPMRQMGSRATEILLRRIRGDRGPSVRETLPHSLTIRKTTALCSRLTRRRG
jgi:LacI family transcriptional regulator